MQLAAQPSAGESAACLHCGTFAAGPGGPFCCTGCRLVYGLLTSQHLDRYYDLRGDRGVPVPEARVERRDTNGSTRSTRSAGASGDMARVVLDVQGAPLHGLRLAARDDLSSIRRGAADHGQPVARPHADPRPQHLRPPRVRRRGGALRVPLRAPAEGGRRRARTGSSSGWASASRSR